MTGHDIIEMVHRISNIRWKNRPKSRGSTSRTVEWFELYRHKHITGRDNRGGAQIQNSTATDSIVAIAIMSMSMSNAKVEASKQNELLS